MSGMARKVARICWIRVFSRIARPSYRMLLVVVAIAASSSEAALGLKGLQPMKQQTPRTASPSHLSEIAESTLISNTFPPVDVLG
jgi:hypothetical protein